MQDAEDKEFLTERIAKKLLAGERLTVLSVHHDLRTYELRHYIPIIKDRYDVDIIGTWHTENGKRFKVYELNKAA